MRHKLHLCPRKTLTAPSQSCSSTSERLSTRKSKKRQLKTTRSSPFELNVARWMRATVALLWRNAFTRHEHEPAGRVEISGTVDGE